MLPKNNIALKGMKTEAAGLNPAIITKTIKPEIIGKSNKVLFKN